MPLSKAAKPQASLFVQPCKILCMARVPGYAWKDAKPNENPWKWAQNLFPPAAPLTAQAATLYPKPKSEPCYHQDASQLFRVEYSQEYTRAKTLVHFTVFNQSIKTFYQSMSTKPLVEKLEGWLITDQIIAVVRHSSSNHQLRGNMDPFKSTIFTSYFLSIISIKFKFGFFRQRYGEHPVNAQD